MSAIRTLFGRLREHYLYQIPLRRKLLYAIMATLFLLVGFFSLFTIYYFSSFAEEQLLNSATETFNQTVIALNHTFLTYDKTTLGLARGDTFDRLMSTDLSHYTTEQLVPVRQSLEKAIFAAIPDHTEGSAYDVDLHIYFNDGFSYFNNPSRYALIEDNTDLGWVRYVLDQYTVDRTDFYIIPPGMINASDHAERDSFAMIRVIMDNTYYPHVLALLRLDIAQDYLNRMISSHAFDHTVSAVVNEEGELIALFDEEASGSYDELLDVLKSRSYGKETGAERIKDRDSALSELSSGAKSILLTLPSGVWNRIDLGDEHYRVRILPVSDYHLLYLSLIPESSLYSDLLHLRRLIWAVFIMVVLLDIPISNLIAGTLTKRLMGITDIMSKVQEGKLIHYSGDTPGKDEIGEVITSYNYMVDQIELLMDREYRLGAEIKNAELKALQLQVNPHFLYNSLDMIYWLAEEGMVSEIQQAVNSLGTFYRIGLSNGREVITLKEELAHAAAYMKLWDLRLRNAIRYEVTVPESLLDCLILKSTLQPLLENAVSHGIREKEQPSGNIQVISKAEGDDLVIYIRDDGIGIRPEMVSKLNRGEQTSTAVNHGYGVFNVQSRLRLYYGSSYGLTYESAEGKGTTVTIRIPRRST